MLFGGARISDAICYNSLKQIKLIQDLRIRSACEKFHSNYDVYQAYSCLFPRLELLHTLYLISWINVLK